MRMIERNCILLYAALGDKCIKEVNYSLRDRECDLVNEKEWALWTNYYKPLAEDNPIYQKEIVCNDRSLDWFARDLKKQTNKDILS